MKTSYLLIGVIIMALVTYLIRVTPMIVFKKKIEEQRAYVKDAIAKDIPNIIMQATVKSEQRIKKLYEEMLADSDKKKYAWLEAQSVAIEIAKPSKVQDALGAVSENIKKLNELLNTIE